MILVKKKYNIGGRVTGDTEEEGGEYYLDSKGNRIMVNLPDAIVEGDSSVDSDQGEDSSDMFSFDLYGGLKKGGETSWGLPYNVPDPSSVTQYTIPLIKRELKEGEEYTDAMRLEDEKKSIRQYASEHDLPGYYDPKYHTHPSGKYRTHYETIYKLPKDYIPE